MAGNVYRIWKTNEYRKAGASDLVELLPAPGYNPLFIPKWILLVLTYSIVNHEFVHLSGPSGTAKSSLLETLYLVSENFNALCSGLGYPVRPLKLYRVEMATYEAPGELYQRRALKDGTTYDEKSRLVEFLEDAFAHRDRAYPLIWLCEIGRVHSSSVQGGLLNLIVKGDIVLPDGSRLDGGEISWIADSNYQAEQDSTHTLVTLDDALKRRFSVPLTLDYLPAEQEVQILQHILRQETIDFDLLVKVVQLGNVIRRHRSEGNLQSLVPPTIYGYLSFLRLVRALPDLSLQQIALTTLLGNAGHEDRKHVAAVFNEVFGLHADVEEEDALTAELF
jgi:hypothetical protein